MYKSNKLVVRIYSLIHVVEYSLFNIFIKLCRNILSIKIVRS